MESRGGPENDDIMQGYYYETNEEDSDCAGWFEDLDLRLTSQLARALLIPANPLSGDHPFPDGSLLVSGRPGPCCWWTDFLAMFAE